MERGATRTDARLVFAAIAAAAVAVAFLWGDYLLGFVVGILYAALTGALLGLFARSLLLTEKPSLVGAVVAIALSLPLAVLMARPTAAIPDLNHFIAQQADGRAASKELAAVFASDPAYGRLSVSTAWGGKVADVTVRGRLNDHPDLVRLRSRIFGECPMLENCYLSWDITLREPAQRVKGYDYELYHDHFRP
jgi:hypothetical protein